jgi:hypothetical protein
VSSSKCIQTTIVSEGSNIPTAGEEDYGIFTGRRSSSVGINSDNNLPLAMKVIGSVNEDGLGMTSWWQ